MEPVNAWLGDVFDFGKFCLDGVRGGAGAGGADEIQSLGREAAVEGEAGGAAEEDGACGLKGGVDGLGGLAFPEEGIVEEVRGTSFVLSLSRGVGFVRGFHGSLVQFLCRRHRRTIILHLHYRLGAVISALYGRQAG